METALKLTFRTKDTGKLRALPWLSELAIETPHTEELVSTDFDTPDPFVRSHRAGLRVRKAGSHWLQTLKTGGQAGSGLHERQE